MECNNAVTEPQLVFVVQLIHLKWISIHFFPFLLYNSSKSSLLHYACINQKKCETCYFSARPLSQLSSDWLPFVRLKSLW